MKAFTLLIGTMALLVHASEAYLNANPFDAIHGCLQFDNVPQYEDIQTYFSTNSFRNIVKTQTSRIMRIGIVGTHDAHIRFGNQVFPYDDTVVEIVLGGWNNTQSAARLQYRARDNTVNNALLKEGSTAQLLSATRPLVFKMEVFNGGLVQLTKDGETRPFFEFAYSKAGLKADYIAFTNCCGGSVFYFYDCPM